METVCLQCGDKGFTDALVYCVMCLEVAVHRYCLDVVSYDEYVRWVCEDCEVEVEVLNPPSIRQTTDRNDEIKICESSSSKNLHEETIENDNLLQHDKLLFDPEIKICESSSSKNLHEENIENDNLMQHDKLLFDPEIKICESSSSKNLHEENIENDHLMQHDKLLFDPEIKICESSSSKNLQEEIIENDNLMQHDKLLFDSLFKGITRKKRSATKKRRNQKILNIEPIKLASDSMMPIEVKENKLFELENQCSETINSFQEFSKDSLISSTIDCNMHVGPETAPIWRGSFNIWNKNSNSIDDLMGHMSTGACQKQHEAASQFGPVLHLEMLPISDVWGKIPESSKLSCQNIALYFFPSDLRSERVFDHLVDEMVEEEVVMRAVLENAELLIFASTELPMPYWRFKEKYYLWGGFRGEGHDNIRSDLCQGESVGESDNALRSFR